MVAMVSGEPLTRSSLVTLAPWASRRSARGPGGCSDYQRNSGHHQDHDLGANPFTIASLFLGCKDKSRIGIFLVLSALARIVSLTRLAATLGSIFLLSTLALGIAPDVLGEILGGFFFFITKQLLVRKCGSVQT
jgi:hypothetical protein